MLAAGALPGGIGVVVDFKVVGEVVDAAPVTLVLEGVDEFGDLFNAVIDGGDDFVFGDGLLHGGDCDFQEFFSGHG
jgi:hypothetical protein